MINQFKEVITRFAPSPTGHLHIGSARTALFNFLFAKKFNGKFLLRIEDTDTARSENKYCEPIFSGLKWLGLQHDDEVVFQSKRNDKYVQIANELLKLGKAYRCFLTNEEIEIKKKLANDNNIKFELNSPWREANDNDINKAIFESKPFVIRLKTPKNSQIEIDDKVQGKVIFNSDEIDDQVLVRSNGQATYMLAVVVDDYDMKITDIIRGDDHLINTPKQILIYQALGWQIPNLYHIPLIHGCDGSKLSKRHGATSIVEYINEYLSISVRNYLMNLGWSSEEYFDTMTLEEAIQIFDPKKFSKGPSRIDFEKLRHINGQNIRNMSAKEVLQFLEYENFQSMMKEEIAEYKINNKLSKINKINIILGLDSILTRSFVLKDIKHFSQIYTEEFEVTDKDLEEFFNKNNEIIDKITIIRNFQTNLSNFFDNIKDNALDLQVGALNLRIDKNNFDIDNINLLKEEILILKNQIEEFCKAEAANNNLKLGTLMKIIRFSLTGLENSPSIFELIAILGPKICNQRLKKTLTIFTKMTKNINHICQIN